MSAHIATWHQGWRRRRDVCPYCHLAPGVEEEEEEGSAYRCCHLALDHDRSSLAGLPLPCMQSLWG